MNHVTHEFDKVIFKDSKILILGSIPSVSSRKKHFYYMNPNNRFYKVLATLIDKEFLDENIDKKIELLKKHHIALYDVIEECDINNSSDSSIKNVIPSNIKEIIKDSNITKIYLNGKKAYELFIKYNKELIDISICLPSTSSANASYTLEKLIKYWEVIKL